MYMLFKNDLQIIFGIAQTMFQCQIISETQLLYIVVNNVVVCLLGGCFFSLVTHVNSWKDDGLVGLH